jgi:hypothetical protein
VNVVYVRSVISHLRELRFGEVKMALVPTSMEEDVKQHHHPSPGDAVIVASGVHPRS